MEGATYACNAYGQQAFALGRKCNKCPSIEDNFSLRAGGPSQLALPGGHVLFCCKKQSAYQFPRKDAVKYSGDGSIRHDY